MINRSQMDKLPFVGPDGTEHSYFENHSTRIGLAGKYVQYKLAIGAVNNIGTPRITEVCVVTDEQ
jgi:hypothetical protein